MITFSDVRVDVAPAGPGQPGRTLLTVASLELGEQRISVIGPNGGGKSTLLQLINGLVEPTAGGVTVDGMDTVSRGREVRRRVGFVFSNPATQLVMPTPREDLELSLRRSVKDKAGRRRRAEQTLEALGIGELADRSSYELSGGQQQLAALATVLVMKPQVLVLDEPTTLLDLRNARRFTGIVGDLAAQGRIQVITATHDLSLAAEAERCLWVEDGAIRDDGAPAQVMGNYVAASA